MARHHDGLNEYTIQRKPPAAAAIPGHALQFVRSECDYDPNYDLKIRGGKRAAMFSKALKSALKYTHPIIVSRQTIAGDCTASIGAFVVVNAEGWIVTAGHVLEQILQLHNEVTTVRDIQAKRTAIEQDGSIGRGEKRRRVAELPKINPKATNRWSAFAGWLGTNLDDMTYVAGVDIGVAKLQGFDGAWVSEYPVFKDPSRDFDPGTSLCRLGFPFHQVTPTWDQQTNTFILPPEAVPIPIFASEGILARRMNLNVAGLQNPPFPMTWFETSSPGLKGQSGGPLFDSKGSIWGIQSNTYSYPLGFSPEVPKGAPGQKEHQFLNVGRAVHTETIIGLFRQVGINFQASNY